MYRKLHILQTMRHDFPRVTQTDEEHQHGDTTGIATIANTICHLSGTTPRMPKHDKYVYILICRRHTDHRELEFLGPEHKDPGGYVHQDQFHSDITEPKLFLT